MKIISLLQSGIPGGRRGWTIPFLILLSSCLTDFVQAQAPPPEPEQSTPQQFSQEELNRLLAPIALYPDALVALILPASTVPSDLVLAARYISSNGDPAQVANQPWDDSVKSLARYPDVLKWMDQNLEWTTAVGEVFLDQPADVMNSIQRLRAEAIATGNLTNSPQQHVVQEESVIRIVPAQPDVIYVPQYDPDVVYVQPYSQNVGPLLTFGAGFAVGSWLNYDCDWGRHSIYVGRWRPGWNHDRNWDRGDQGQNNKSVNVVNISSDTARQWQPSANSQRRQAQHQRSNGAHARSASVNTLDADHQPGGPSTPGLTRSADPRANHIPKPSRPDFTSQSNERIRRDAQDSNGSSKTSSGFPPAPNVATDATPRARGKNHKVSAPTVAPNVPDEQGTPGQSGGQGGNPRKLSKHVQSSHQSKGGANSQPTTTPSTMQPSTSTQKHQKHVDPSQSSSPQSNNSPQSSNGQKHQQKHAPQSAPSLAKQNKPSQPQPAAAHHEQNSQRSTASAPQNIAPQPSNASHGKGKGKGGGEKKTDEKKNKGDN